MISATRAPNGEGGCFSLREKTHEISTRSTEGTRIGPTGVFVRKKLEHHQFDTSYSENVNLIESFPLFSRAWCYQERLLSVRVLHYCESEMVWDCRVGTTCECGHLKQFFGDKSAYSTTLAGKDANDIDMVADEWANVVQEYSVRRLTIQRDILPAISGVASQLHDKRLGRYLAGLWENTLPGALVWYSDGALVWYSDGSDHQNAVSHTWNHRPKTYTAPSWSWASVVGHTAFSYRSNLKDRTEFYVDIMKAACVPKSANIYGEVTAGELVLTGPTTTAIFEEVKTSRKNIGVLSRLGKSQRFHLDTEEDALALVGWEVLCLLVCTELINLEYLPASAVTSCQKTNTMAMILIPSQDNHNVYKRVGLMRHGDLAFFDGAERSTIVII